MGFLLIYTRKYNNIFFNVPILENTQILPIWNVTKSTSGKHFIDNLHTKIKEIVSKKNVVNLIILK